MAAIPWLEDIVSIIFHMRFTIDEKLIQLSSKLQVIDYCNFWHMAAHDHTADMTGDDS